jgi:hypothetical protein
MYFVLFMKSLLATVAIVGLASSSQPPFTGLEKKRKLKKKTKITKINK